ncbi:hypothetical protein GYMLUDRAFT_251198 [Collybiopsis luxurians FD-317 M1]|uniref:Uncharacterized protein n=1 Tax=Collybiopsis luxurians FD-317 M1 TaxID=944289 RepID=A0A0D0AQE1_9AGAR|nr:hypothetical protein GYMLUDRAFT_251198 [Collybiopsis luxurians FD-317 M1]
MEDFEDPTSTCMVGPGSPDLEADEVQYLWKGPVRISAALFFFGRYLALLGNVVVTVSSFSAHLPESVSTFLSTKLLADFSNGRVAQYLPAGFARHYAGHMLLTVRIYALYHCSKRVLAILLLIAAVLTSLSIFSTFFDQTNHSEETPVGCHTEFSFITSVSTYYVADRPMKYFTSSTFWVEIAAAWEASFLYDLTLFFMTLFRAYKTRHELRTLRKLRIPLTDIILRDGKKHTPVFYHLVRPDRVIQFL